MSARILLINPKYAHNVGAVVRAASCYSAESVRWTGKRVKSKEDARERLPREERMKQYQEVDFSLTDRPFEGYPKGVTPVAIELLPNCESLHAFEHPEDALYVFGPEDGGLTGVTLRHCHGSWPYPPCTA